MQREWGKEVSMLKQEDADSRMNGYWMNMDNIPKWK